MCDDSIVSESAVGQAFSTPLNPTLHERERLVRVPVLRDERRGKEKSEYDSGEARHGHHRAISRALVAAASVAAVGAMSSCDIQLPVNETHSLDELLVVQRQATAPAVLGATFWVANDRATVRRLQHQDAFNQLFAEIRFAPGALAALDGQPVGPTDSVLVTVEPSAGVYGLAIGPSGLTFASGSRPSVLFSFGRYGDLSVADGSSYTSREAYANALDIWEEIGFDRWQVASRSSAAGIDAVSASIVAAGEVVLAALR